MIAIGFIWALLALIVLQTILYRRFSLKKISYLRTFSTPAAMEGDTIEMIETIQNRKLLPLPFLRIESKINAYLRFSRQDNLDISMEQFHSSMFFLGSYQKIIRRHRVYCSHRGYFRLYQTTLTCSDLFGLNERRMDLSTELFLAVLPSIPSADQLPDGAIKLMGDLSARRWILPDPILYTGVRAYQTWDDPRDIHWRATAQEGSLQVKVRDYTISPRLAIILNVQLRDGIWDKMEPAEQETMEEAVRCAAGLIDWAIHQGMEVSLITNSEMAIPLDSSFFRSDFVGGTAGEDALLLALAQLNLQRRIQLSALMEQLQTSMLPPADYAIITPYWNEKLEDCRQGLLQTGSTAAIIHILSSEIS